MSAGLNAVYYWCLIAIMMIGGWQIKNRLNESRQGLSELSPDAQHVSDTINWILIFVCGGISLPCSGFAVWNCVMTEYIDSHTWSIELLWCCYFSAMILYLLFMCLHFWKEVGRKTPYNSTKAGSTYTASTFSTNTHTVS